MQYIFQKQIFLHNRNIQSVHLSARNLWQIFDTFSFVVLRWAVMLAYSSLALFRSRSTAFFLVSSFFRWRKPRAMRFRTTSARATLPKSAKNFRRREVSLKVTRIAYYLLFFFLLFFLSVCQHIAPMTCEIRRSNFGRVVQRTTARLSVLKTTKDKLRADSINARARAKEFCRPSSFLAGGNVDGQRGKEDGSLVSGDYGPSSIVLDRVG